MDSRSEANTEIICTEVHIISELRFFEGGPCRSGFLLSLNFASLKEDPVGLVFVVSELRSVEGGRCRSGFCCLRTALR